MGCDVHCHFEIKVDGEWLHYSAPHIDRNYQLFSKMAGVRGEETPIAKPRGLPQDATKTTKLVSDYDCGHTHSWLSADEIGELARWYEDTFCKKGAWHSFETDGFGYLFGNGWDYKKYPKSDGGYDGVPIAIQDVRLVFWFNS